MQSQFTDKARAALLLAEKTAKRLRQGYVGTEHILVGLMQEKTGVAARVLFDNGVDEKSSRGNDKGFDFHGWAGIRQGPGDLFPESREGAGYRQQAGRTLRGKADRHRAYSDGPD